MQWIEHIVESELPAAPEEMIRRLDHLAGTGQFSGSTAILPLLSTSALQEMRRHLYADLKLERLGLLLGRAFYA